MSFQLISAILHGQWAISPAYAHQVMPLILKMLEGEKVDFGFSEKPQIQAPQQIFSAAAAGVYNVGPYSDVESLPYGSIAVVNISGPIMKYGGMCSYGSIDKTRSIASLANADNISAIILNIDSPGGQVAGTTMLADAVKDAGSKKPVVAMIDDGIAASAAMWIASAAQEIFVTKKSDEVGSIGVFTTLMDMLGYYKKQGLNGEQIYSRLSTDKNGSVREALAGNKEPLMDELDQTAQDFIDTIRSNRGDRIKGDEWTTGKMFRAKDAAKIGLIDGIKSFEQIIDHTSKKVSTKNSKNMKTATVAAVETPVVAFAAIMGAAGIAAITVVDQGFAMDETAMNALEAHITTQNSTIADRDATITQLNQKIQDLGQNDQSAEIARLNARIEELEGEPAGNFAATTKEVDQVGKTAGDKFFTSYDAEKQRLRALKNGTA